MYMVITYKLNSKKYFVVSLTHYMADDGDYRRVEGGYVNISRRPSPNILLMKLFFPKTDVYDIARIS